ncbi:MAG: sigma-54 dependent transcriptional regulator [Candidatus Sulfotelmatobacter sp.]
MEISNETTRLLVVSREMAALRSLWSIVEANSWHLETAPTGWDAMERVQSGVTPHLLILDLPRGDGDSLHVVRWMRRLRPTLPILLLCHASEADRKDDAIRLGADDVLVRPFPDGQLESLIDRYLRNSRENQMVEVVSENIEPMGEDGFFVSAGPAMRKLRAQVELLAQADVPVLILGEAATGIDTVARLVHRLSVRSGFKFQKINCSGVPGDLLEKEIFGTEKTSADGLPQVLPGKLESAGRGVLLFDEITEMPQYLQAQLLSVLRDGHYVRTGGQTTLSTDCRILASTSANIERALSENRFREDLYYRLSAFTVQVPPLRQRKEEIPVLLQHFMHKLARHYGLTERQFSSEVIEACQKHSWPGNLKELETFVKRYIVAGESNSVEVNCEDPGAVGDGVSHIGQNCLSTSETEGPRSLKSLIQSIKCETERNAIGIALDKTGWNRKAAARLLKVSYRTLLYKIDQYEMTAHDPSFPSFDEKASLQAIAAKGNGKAS